MALREDAASGGTAIANSDIRAEDPSVQQGGRDLAEHYADAVCPCGGRVFDLYLDDTAGVASRVCVACDAEPHAIGDSGEFMDESEEEECACPCGQELFEGISARSASRFTRTARMCAGCTSGVAAQRAGSRLCTATGRMSSTAIGSCWRGCSSAATGTAPVREEHHKTQLAYDGYHHVKYSRFLLHALKHVLAVRQDLKTATGRP